MSIINPTKTNRFIDKLLQKIDSDFEYEIVPINPEEFAINKHCYANVEEKVKRDGGKIHYGWAIYQSDILCEAERHAVWENENEDLIDITPNDLPISEIMFVSDNIIDGDVNDTDNIRINITGTQVVDDFIFLCETISKIFSTGKRINNNQINVNPKAERLIIELRQAKDEYLNYIYKNGLKPNEPCICGQTNKNYKNCHGKIFKKRLNEDIVALMKGI